MNRQNIEQIIIKAPDYFQEHLPADKWTYHFEARRNYGTEQRPHWETVAYGSTEEEVKRKVSIIDDIAFEKQVGEYWQKELAKPQRPVYYLPTAQRGAESLIGPLEQQ